jgi:hypothetical protein
MKQKQKPYIEGFPFGLQINDQLYAWSVVDVALKDPEDNEIKSALRQIRPGFFQDYHSRKNRPSKTIMLPWGRSLKSYFGVRRIRQTTPPRVSDYQPRYNGTIS